MQLARFPVYWLIMGIYKESVKISDSSGITEQQFAQLPCCNTCGEVLMRQMTTAFTLGITTVSSEVEAGEPDSSPTHRFPAGIRLACSPRDTCKFCQKSSRTSSLPRSPSLTTTEYRASERQEMRMEKRNLITLCLSVVYRNNCRE